MLLVPFFRARCSNNANNQPTKERVRTMKTEILEIIAEKQIDLNSISDAHELREALDYDGSLHELIDGMIDIYYYDIRQWAVGNWEYVEKAINEGLIDTSDFDYHKAIQAGQYIYYSERAEDALDEIMEESKVVA